MLFFDLFFHCSFFLPPYLALDDVVQPLAHLHDHLVLGVVDLGLVHPVGGLGVGRVVDLRLGEVPVVDELARRLGLEVEEDQKAKAT